MRYRIMTALVLAVAALSLAERRDRRAVGQQPAPQSGAESGDIEVLTRGPIHEAFAEPAFGPAQRGPVVLKEPPPAIEELPPDQKPQGAAVWITGYWAWDDEREDFLWVSGIWRVPPPDRRWISGYWVKTAEGYQRISGYWAPEKLDEADYLPEPPPSVESGPSSPAPAPGYVWVSGCWVWHSNRYLWRTGYWTEADDYWMWIPDHYVWTPAGCVYVAGYWDYPLDRRGLMFAPIYYRRPVYLRPRFYYTPTVVLHTPAIGLHLFLRPSQCHYYFGDYYDPAYRMRGYHYWCHWHSFGHGWDPLFVFYYQRHRHEHDWLDRHRRHYDELFRKPDFRPAHRFGEHRAEPLLATGKMPANLATRLDALPTIDRQIRLVKLDAEERNLALRTIRHQRTEQSGRAKLEERGRELRSRPVSGTVATKLSVAEAAHKGRVILQPGSHREPATIGTPARKDSTGAGAQPRSSGRPAAVPGFGRPRGSESQGRPAVEGKPARDGAPREVGPAPSSVARPAPPPASPPAGRPRGSGPAGKVSPPKTAPPPAGQPRGSGPGREGPAGKGSPPKAAPPPRPSSGRAERQSALPATGKLAPSLPAAAPPQPAAGPAVRPGPRVPPTPAAPPAAAGRSQFFRSMPNHSTGSSGPAAVSRGSSSVKSGSSDFSRRGPARSVGNRESSSSSRRGDRPRR